MLKFLFVESVTDVTSIFSIYVIAAVSLFLLFVWRLLRFSILPMLRPEEPKEIPYWIPGEVYLEWTRATERQLLTGLCFSPRYHLPFSATACSRLDPDKSLYFSGHILSFLNNSDQVFTNARLVLTSMPRLSHSVLRKKYFILKARKETSQKHPRAFRNNIGWRKGIRLDIS